MPEDYNNETNPLQKHYNFIFRYRERNCCGFTSHHLGLDTHDYGILTEPMKANMVFTVEPGIYIPAEGFGIRLEDNVVVQETGEPFNLMRNIPIEVEEIETIMNS